MRTTNPHPKRNSKASLRHARLAWLFALAWIAATALLTLSPTSSRNTLAFLYCFVCGERGLADAILNVGLFIPIGFLLSLITIGPVRPVVAALAISASIEMIQFAIPGRFPSVGDLVTNALGAAIGVGLAVTRSAWWTRRDFDSRTLWGISTVGSVGTLLATALLLMPNLPETRYYGQWTPRLGHLKFYTGRVQSARLGDVAIAPDEITQTARIRDAFLGGLPLEITGTAGTPTTGLAPLVSLFDEFEREVLLVGVDRFDLTVRFRTHAAATLLDQPTVTLSGAFEDVRPGDSLVVTVRRQADGVFCLSLLTPSQQRDTCRAGFTLGQGWAILKNLSQVSPVVAMLLNIAWIMCLTALVGWWAPGRAHFQMSGGLVAAALALIPWWVGGLPTPVHQWIACGLGLVCGYVLNQRHRLLHLAP